MASLGELFIQLAFEGDTEGAEKFKKKVEEVVKECDKAINKNTKLQDSAKKTSDEHKKGASSVAQFAKGLAGFVAAATGAIYALQKLTDSLIQDNQAWLNLTRQSDIALESFQKWGSVGKLLGVDDAAQSLESLNEKLFELRLTGQGAQAFMLAGINPTNAEDVLEQLRARVSGMPDTSASFLLRQMGLNPQMLHLLRMSRAEFEALNAELSKYRLTPQQRKDIQMFNVQIQIASQKLQYLRQRVILALMPTFTRLIQSLARVSKLLFDFAKSFKNSGKVKAITIAVGALLAKLFSLGKFFKELSGSFSSIITKIPIFGRLLGGLGKFAAKILLPFTALYLILDDIAAYMDGRGSMLGVFMQWWEDSGKGLSDAFSKISNGDIGGGLMDLLGMMAKTLDSIAQMLGSLFEKIAFVNPYKLGTKTGEKTLKWLIEHSEAVKKNMQERGVTVGADGSLIKDGVPVEKLLSSNAGNSYNKTATINQQNYITTSETAQSVERGLDLLHTNYVMSV